MQSTSVNSSTEHSVGHSRRICQVRRYKRVNETGHLRSRSTWDGPQHSVSQSTGIMSEVRARNLSYGQNSMHPVWQDISWLICWKIGRGPALWTHDRLQTLRISADLRYEGACFKVISVTRGVRWCNISRTKVFHNTWREEFRHQKILN